MHNILIVDDNNLNRFYLRTIINSYCKKRELEYKLHEAENGLDAVNITTSLKGDISYIVMDIKMPIMDGIEASKKIKEIYKNIPIIVCTAYEEDYIQDNPGIFVEQLSKPVSCQMAKELFEKYSV